MVPGDGYAPPFLPCQSNVLTSELTGHFKLVRSLGIEPSPREILLLPTTAAPLRIKHFKLGRLTGLELKYFSRRDK